MTHTFKHMKAAKGHSPLPVTPMSERNVSDRNDNIAFTWGVPIM